MPFIDWDKYPTNEVAPGVRIRTPYVENLMLSRVEFDAGAVVPMHSHPHEQFSLLLEGELRLTVGDETRDIGPGDGWYAPGGVPHGGLVLGDAAAVFIDVYSPATSWIMGELASARPVPAVGRG